MASNSPITPVWPPIYIVKKHPRARRVKLRTSVRHGLELTVPKHFNIKKIPALLDENRPWIEKQLLQLELNRQAINFDALPHSVLFQATSAIWNIQYVACDTKLQIISRPQQEIVLMGNIQDKNTCKSALVTWIKDQAKIYLHTQLKTISDQTGLLYKKLAIRDQKTRWGSCSTRKAINLNYKLIFLPEPLVNHIIIHELCHTIHLNHSEHFWQLVAKFDFNWKEHNRAMRQAGKLIPAWLS